MQVKVVAILFILLFFLLSACSDEGESSYKLAKESFEKGDYSSAKLYAYQVVKRPRFIDDKYALLSDEIIKKIETLEKQKKQEELQREQEELQREQEETRKRSLERAGYKEAKWGMSPKKVKKALNMKIVSEGNDYINFGKVTCWFFKNKFYRAIYDPKLGDNNTKDYEAVLRALVEKYGGGRELKDKVDAFSRIPLLVYLWEDEFTEIKLRMFNPEIWSKSSDIFPSSTLIIIYESKEIRNEKEIEESQKERSKIEEGSRSMKSDL